MVFDIIYVYLPAYHAVRCGRTQPSLWLCSHDSCVRQNAKCLAPELLADVAARAQPGG